MGIHFVKRYPLNSRLGRIVTAVFLIVTLLIGLFGLSRSREFDRRMEAGELAELQATVERITITGKGEDRDYDVRVSYTFGGTDYENIELSWYTSEMEEGAPTVIYISPDTPGKPCSDPSDFFRLLVPPFLGAAALCFLLAWIPRKTGA